MNAMQKITERCRLNGFSDHVGICAQSFYRYVSAVIPRLWNPFCRRPDDLAAACVYVAAIHIGEPRTLADVARAFGVSDTAVQKYAEIVTSSLGFKKIQVDENVTTNA